MKLKATKVTSKGQITIPKEIRRRMGVGPGDKVEFKEAEGKFVLAKRVERSPFEQYIGYLKKKRGRKSDEIIAELRGE